MKKIYNIAIAALIGIAAVSCDSADVKVPVSTPVVSEQGATYESLSFKWSKVEGVNQYGIRLINPEGKAVYTAVTRTASVEITGLEPATEYTLEITAYAADMSSNGSSVPLTLKATTDPLTPLDTPLIYDETIYNFVFTWDAVSLASGYEYTLTKDGETVHKGIVDEETVTFSNGSLADGNYNLSIVALTSTPGYCSSPVATIAFQGGIHKAYECTGTYTSAVLGTSWEVTLIAYSDLSYEMKGWCGVSGYDLNFDCTGNVTSNFQFDSRSLTIEGVEADAQGYSPVETGLTSMPTLRIDTTNAKTQVRQRKSSGNVFVDLYVVNPTTGVIVKDSFKATNVL